MSSSGPKDAVPGSVSNRRLTAFKSSRGTLITDETGTQEIIKGNELYEQELIPARYYGGFQRQVLINGEMDEWAMHMTNPKTLPNNFQLSPEGRVPVKLKDIFEREKDSYENLGYSYLRTVSLLYRFYAFPVQHRSHYRNHKLSWIIHNEYFYKQNKVYSLSWPEEEFWNKMNDPSKGYIGIRANGENAEMIAAKEKDLTVGMLTQVI